MGFGTKNFLSGLAGTINEQFSFGENSVTSLDADGFDRTNNFGALGDFSEQFDQSAERTYIEDGFISNVRPRVREVVWQQPEMSILIKKRMFSSLAENFKLDLMEDKEKLFYRASKRLFLNKARTIATYERLSKIEKSVQQSGVVNTFMYPTILGGIADLDNAGFTLFDPSTIAAINKLRRVFAFNAPSSTTNWAMDQQTAFMSDLGEGTGVIELTTVKEVSTKVSTKFGEGNASLNVEDPYKLLIITSAEIDRAISDSTNFFRNSGFGRFTQQQTVALIDDLKRQLSALRKNRGASQIRFVVTPETKISKRVRAIMESEGREIQFTYSAGLVGVGGGASLDSTELSESFSKNFISDSRAVDRKAQIRFEAGGSSSEKELFEDIIKNIFLLIGLENTTRSEMTEFQGDANYVRRKMELHFGDKPIIQPMDIVNVFIGSHKQTDDRLTSGFSSNSSNLQNSFENTLNTLVQNINNFGAKSSQFSGVQLSVDDIERESIVGPDYPKWLWNTHKADFTRQNAGLAVFVGIVRGASHNYSNGVYSLSVNCEDNAGYFNKGQINIKPAMDVFNGNLYDPLTPFDISFDAATGAPITDILDNEFPPLLPENNIMNKSANVKFKAGRFRGSRISSFLFKANDRELGTSGFRRVINSPDGFVYRWKEGIESLTKNERVQPDSSVASKEKSVLLTKNPFAGQDVMNVLSLLVTGQPYTFNTFLKAAIQNVNGVVSRGELNNEDDAISYIDGLVSDLVRNNSTWGNFVPFKKLVVNDAAMAFIVSGQASFQKNNQKLQSLINRRARLMDDLFFARNRGFNTDPQQFKRDSETGQLDASDDSFNVAEVKLSNEINSLDLDIEKAQLEYSTTIDKLVSSNKGNIKLIGDDLSIDDPSLFDMGNAKTEGQEQLDKTNFRNKLGALTLRRFWQVKGNENDRNLFIVDDQYDKNFDIQSFERAIGNSIDKFSSEYTSVDGQIKNVATILGLEVFADSQGHIQARPPLYNRVPSSVFQKMFKDKSERGVQVFPQFLESLFFNQIQGIINRIEILEDQIRLRGAAISLLSDAAISRFIQKGTSNNFGEFVAADVADFSFTSNETTGKVGSNDFRKFIQQSKPDLNENNRTKTLTELERVSGTLLGAAKSNILFDSPARFNVAKERNFKNTLTQEADDRAFKIRQRLKIKKGVKTPTIRDLISNDRFKEPGVSQLDSLKITGELVNLISERQRMLLQASNAIKNLDSGVRVNSDEQGATSALFPGLNRKKISKQGGEIPDILEHMIEDENNNDLGPGSGTRFILNDSNIISLTIEETPPPHTAVQVNGLFGQGLTEPPSNLRLDNSGGNFVTSAFAVDYDMWRMYGFRASNAVPAPFFSDPEAQCAPYAVYLLNLARKNILQGSATVVGNEYYQAGDVIYVEDRDLLFYVEDVQQSFSYSGGSFTTTLALKFGHKPGEYIPTILDIVGKALYNSKNNMVSFRNQRFATANGDVPLGTVTFDNRGALSPLTDILSGSRGEANRRSMSNILVRASGALGGVGKKKPILELRVYTNSQVTGPADTSLVDAANELLQWFTNPQKFSSETNSLIAAEENQSFSFLNDGSIRVLEVDAAGDNQLSPSNTAWNAVKLMMNNPFPSDRNVFEVENAVSNQDNILRRHIIDVWITFEEATESNESIVGGVVKTAKSQAESDARTRLDQAAKRRTEQS